MLKIRLKEARIAKGYTQHELADLTNSTQSAVYKIEIGKTSNPRNLASYAKALGVSEEWLRYGISEARSDARHLLKSNAEELAVKFGDTKKEGLGLDSSGLGESARPVFVDIPVYDIYFSAGPGCFFDSAEILRHHSISLEYLDKYNLSSKNASVFTVKGESMEHTLNDGDTILVDRSINKPKNNKVFAFSFDGELKVKRFFHQLDGSWRISSDNEDKNRYQDEFVYNAKINELDIVGQVLTILDRPLI
jgi:phage repressor protein C with HTH and peptisase S24 domain